MQSSNPTLRNHQSTKANSSASLEFESSVEINQATILDHIESLTDEIRSSRADLKVDFPLDVFPAKIQKIIESLQQSLNFPIEYTGAALLVAAAVAIGNTHEVKVKAGWHEGPVIYLSLVGPPGAMKSHPISFALRPIEEYDKGSYSEFLMSKQLYEVAAAMSKKEFEESGQDKPSKPIWRKHIVTDFTIEALSEVMKVNQRGLVVHQDELVGWIKNFNRYSKGSEQESWLSFWSRKSKVIDRKGSDPVLLTRPCISVVGTIQKGILTELTKDGRASNGFIERLLFVAPNDVQKPYWSTYEASQDVFDGWSQVILKLLNLPLRLSETFEPIPDVLHLDSTGNQIFLQWHKKHTDACNNCGSEAIASIFSKMDIYLFRFSLILELLYWACGESSKEYIGPQALSSAIRLVEYFKSNALIVHSMLQRDSSSNDLTYIKKQFYDQLASEFTTAEARKAGSRFGISDRSLARYLKEDNIFEKVRQGQYRKIQK